VISEKRVFLLCEKSGANCLTNKTYNWAFE
jgi:hypothetical protein